MKSLTQLVDAAACGADDACAVVRLGGLFYDERMGIKPNGFAERNAMINVGFIGCGRIADLHVLAYSGHPGARLYAICDPDPECLAQRRTEWQPEKAYTEYRALLDDPRVDAVEILCPYDRHEPVFLDAVRAGKHVACQKPMTTTLASARRMTEAARQSAKITKITEIYLQFPPIAMAKQLLEDGAIGEPLGLRINYISSPKGGWHVPARTYEQQVRIAALGLGLETFDHGHHEWATAWYLLGEAERVSAWIDTLNGVVDGPATVMWKGRNNKRYGVCDFMFAPDMPIPSKYYSNDEMYQLVGSKGIIMINRGTGELHDRPPLSLFDGAKWTHFPDLAGDWAQGFIGAGRNFIAAIEEKEQPLLSMEQGSEVLRFAMAVTLSARKRREVFLDELERPFPWCYNRWRRWREGRDCVVRPQRRTGWFSGGLAKYAPQAAELTLRLPERFDPAAAGEWECVIGLMLTGENGVGDASFALTVRQGRLEVTAGSMPENPDLRLTVRAGVWAALLLGKKRIETAIMQGMIQYSGDVEKALPLRAAFKI